MDLSTHIQGWLADRIFRVSSPSRERQALGNILTLAALVFSLAGLGFLVFAAHLWLSRHYQPDIAAAATGLVSLLVSLFLAFLAILSFYARRSMLRAIRAETQHLAQEVMELIEGFIADPVRSHPKTAVLLAFMAGLLAEESILPAKK